jgi:hypothetical protein
LRVFRILFLSLFNIIIFLSILNDMHSISSLILFSWLLECIPNKNYCSVFPNSCLANISFFLFNLTKRSCFISITSSDIFSYKNHFFPLNCALSIYLLYNFFPSQSCSYQIHFFFGYFHHIVSMKYVFSIKVFSMHHH